MLANHRLRPVARGALVLLALAGIASSLAGGASPARRATGYVCPPDVRLAGPDLHFRAADGTRLVGHRFGRGSTTIVLANQAESTLCLWVSDAQRFASRGYSAIVFDFRNTGQSQSRKAPLDKRVDADLAAAVRLARSQGAKKVYLIGASMGAWASIIVGASLRPGVQGVVSVSAPAEWSTSAVASARRLTVPVLYLASSGDGSFPTDARKLYAATASRDKTLKIIPGAFHGVDLVEVSAAARGAVDAFLRRH